MSSCGSNTCHGGELNSGDGSMAILAVDGNFVNTYTDGSLLNINLNITDSDALRFGFQMVALNEDGESVGNFVTNDADNLAIQVGQGIEFINHRDIPAMNNSEFNFAYQAPDQNVGPITFYAAGMAADGGGNAQNDKRYGAELEITWTEISSIADNISRSISIFPNPSSDHLVNISNVPFEKATIEIFDLQGKLHFTQPYSNQQTIDLSSLGAGLYVTVISNDQYATSQKLVLR